MSNSLPDELRDTMRAAIRLEYWNLFWTSTIIVVMGWRGMFIGCSLGLSIVRIRVLLNLHTSLFEMPAHAEAMRDGCQSNSTNISELKTTTQGDSPRAPERSSFTIKSPKE